MLVSTGIKQDPNTNSDKAGSRNEFQNPRRDVERELPTDQDGKQTGKYKRRGRCGKHAELAGMLVSCEQQRRELCFVSQLSQTSPIYRCVRGGGSEAIVCSHRLNLRCTSSNDAPRGRVADRFAAG